MRFHYSLNAFLLAVLGIVVGASFLRAPHAGADVLTGFGYGSDDKSGTLAYQRCELKVDGTTGNCTFGFTQTSTCNGGGNDSSPQVNSSCFGGVGTAWGWGASTSGGGVPNKCGNDGSPGGTAIYYQTQAIDPNSNLRTGAKTDGGNYIAQGYALPNLKIINYLDTQSPEPWWVITRTYMSLADDGDIGTHNLSCGFIGPIPAPELDAPSNTCDIATTRSKVTLTWTDRGGGPGPNPNPSHAADAYDVYWYDENGVYLGGPVPLPGDIFTYEVTDLDPATNYQFEVRSKFEGAGLPGSFSRGFRASNRLAVTTAACAAPAPCEGELVANPTAGNTCPGTWGDTMLTWKSSGCAERSMWVQIDAGTPIQFLATEVFSPATGPNLPDGNVLHAMLVYFPPIGAYDFELRGTDTPGGAHTILSKAGNQAWEHVEITELACAPPYACSGTYPATAACVASGGTISANPTSGTVCPAVPGNTDITWGASGGSLVPEVWIKEDPDGAVGPLPFGPFSRFATGWTGNQSAPWIQGGHLYTFELREGVQVLDSVDVTATTLVCIPPAVCQSAAPTFMDPLTTVCAGAAASSNYKINYSGPGPEEVLGSGRQTWFRGATGSARPTSQGNFANCSGPGPLCTMVLGGEIEFVLDFVDPFDFNLSRTDCIAPNEGGTCSVLPGQTANYSVTIVAKNGFAGTVNLSTAVPGLSYVDSWPGGSTCVLAVNGSCTRTFFVTPNAGSTPVDYQFTVIARIPGSASVRLDPATLRVWDFDFRLDPPTRTASYGETITYGVTAWGINGYNKFIDCNCVSIVNQATGLPTAPNPAFGAGLPFSSTVPLTPIPTQVGTFTVIANGLCNTTYVVTVNGRSGPVTKSRTAEFTLDNAPPTISVNPAGTVCRLEGTDTVRQIQIDFAFTPEMDVTLERSINNFATVEKTYNVPAHTANCIDRNGPAGSDCNAVVPPIAGVPARAAAGQGYYYRVVGNACGLGVSPPSNIVFVPTPDCPPQVLTGANLSPTSTITSWCAQGGGQGTTAPSVDGFISWQYCDPDNANWASCASQTPPSYSFDPQDAFCVQISSDPAFLALEFNPDPVADPTGCGTALSCGAIGLGTGCISGELPGSAAACAFGNGASCMPGTLTYNTTYYYRVKVKDGDTWNGANGPMWSPSWSCTPPNCPLFRQDHYIGDFKIGPASGVRAGQETNFYASAKLYTDDAGPPPWYSPRALYSPTDPPSSWVFDICESGPSLGGCDPFSIITSSTGTVATTPLPAAFSTWPVYGTSQYVADILGLGWSCPTGANRPQAREGAYRSGIITHTFQNEGLASLRVSAYDNDGHFCPFEQAFPVKPRIPRWYEVVPRR